MAKGEGRLMLKRLGVGGSDGGSQEAKIAMAATRAVTAQGMVCRQTGVAVGTLTGE